MAYIVTVDGTLVENWSVGGGRGGEGRIGEEAKNLLVLIIINYNNGNR